MIKYSRVDNSKGSKMRYAVCTNNLETPNIIVKIISVIVISLNLSLLNAKLLPYANSIDPHETPSYSDPSCFH